MNKQASILQNAVVLHTRPYRDTSMLIDFFCEDSGLVRCISKGQRSKKNASQLSQFNVFSITFSGKSDLKTLMVCELNESSLMLQRQALFCGLYVNELLMRLLIQFDPHPQLFQALRSLYKQISMNDDQYYLEEKLRGFEFMLLREMGYLVDFKHDCHDGSLVNKDFFYRFEPEHGFFRIMLGENKQAEQIRSVSGESLLLLSELIKANDFYFNKSSDAENFRKDCKWLSRIMLTPYLGDKPLQSRRLFESLKQA